MNLPDYSEYLNLPGKLEQEEKAWKESKYIHVRQAKVVNEICKEYGLKSVVEIGCGTGNILEYLNKKLLYYGFDKNKAALKLAKEKHPRAMFREGDVRDISQKKLDLVFCFAFMKHFSIEEWNEILFRISKLGRYVIFDIHILTGDKAKESVGEEDKLLSLIPLLKRFYGKNLIINAHIKHLIDAIDESFSCQDTHINASVAPKKINGISDRKRKYLEYLNSVEWKRFRMMIIEERGHKCELCGAINEIQVHHKTYINLFNEQREDVQLLCKPCHKRIHKKQKEKRLAKREKRKIAKRLEAKRKLGILQNKR